jgi:hypothetical protein
LGAHDLSGERALVAMARPNQSFTQLLNRHFSLHFSSTRAPAHRCSRNFAERWYGSCVKLFPGFCLTPAFHACYKEGRAIHIGVRRHTN